MSQLRRREDGSINARPRDGSPSGPDMSPSRFDISRARPGNASARAAAGQGRPVRSRPMRGITTSCAAIGRSSPNGARSVERDAHTRPVCRSIAPMSSMRVLISTTINSPVAGRMQEGRSSLAIAHPRSRPRVDDHPVAAQPSVGIGRASSVDSVRSRRPGGDHRRIDRPDRARCRVRRRSPTPDPMTGPRHRAPSWPI